MPPPVSDEQILAYAKRQSRPLVLDVSVIQYFDSMFKRTRTTSVVPPNHGRKAPVNTASAQSRT
jgi:hypothetical protein